MARGEHHRIHAQDRSQRNRLRVALKEVVKNACEASPVNGVVEVAAHARARPAKGKGKNGNQPLIWVAISVSDSGQGIAPEMCEKIFQPFYSTKGKRDAAGLEVVPGLVEL